MEKLIKSYRDLGGAALNDKQLKKYNAEMERTIKYTEKYVKLTTQQAKIMREGPERSMREQEKIFDRITKKMDLAQKRQTGPALGDRWLHHKIQQFGSGYGDPTNQPLRDHWEARARAMNMRAREQHQGDIDLGREAIERRMRREEDDRMRDRQERTAKLMTIGAGIKVAGAAVGSTGDVVYGASMRKAGFEAEAAGFAGKMYNDLVGGDYTGLAAILRNPKALGQFRSLVNDAKTNSQFQQFAQGAEGVGSTALGAATMLSSGGMGPMAGLTMTAGAGTTVGGIRDATMAVQNAYLGKTAADTSSAAIRGLEFIKASDPIRLRQIGELQGRLAQIHQHAALSGGVVGIGDEGGTNMAGDPYSLYNRMVKMGSRAGLGSDQAMGVFESLRGQLTHKAAGSTANFEVAAAAPHLLGMGRESAIGGMGVLGRTMMSGGDGASVQLIQVMRKAMAYGIEDSRLKETITATLPQMLETGAGRSMNLNSMDELMRLATNISKQHGGEMDPNDIRKAAGAMQLGSAISGGNTGLAPLDVQMVGPATNMLMRKYGKGGMTGNLAGLLATMPLGDLQSRNQENIAYMEQAGIKGEEAQEKLLEEIRLSKVAGLRRLFPGQTDTVIAGMMKRQFGSDWETTFGMTGFASKEGQRRKGVMELPQPTRQETGEEKIFKTLQGKAFTENQGITGALENQDVQDNLGDTVAAAGAITSMFNELSKMNNLDAIRDVPGLLQASADRLNDLGDAAARFSGQPRGASEEPESIDSTPQ
jgi:hypothetical protein